MVGLTGISYKTSTVDVRERFSLSKDEIIPFSELLQKETDISEIVVLSTCNRTEIYFSQDKYEFNVAAKLIYKTLKRFKEVKNKYWNFFYSYSNDEAIRHLFQVASGIDSMIIGEDQIIGQIKEAYMICTEAALTDAVLMRLFQKSFEAGKRVRTETKIKMGTTSISSAAVQKCAQEFEELSDKKVLMIGAGETGTLVLQNFRKNGSPTIAVTNRTAEKAEKLAERHDCNLLHFDQVSAHLYHFDIIIVATGSPVPLVTQQMVENNLHRRTGLKQVFIDLSVPRNIENNIEQLQYVKLFTIDDLQVVVDSNMEKRKECIDAANTIIEEMVDDFSEWLAGRSLRPAIKAITYNMLKITKEELSGYKSDSEETQLAVNEFSKHLTQKYTRLFIKNLKHLTANGKKTDSLKLVNELFNIGEL
ncbi:MAG TPA: glutamyl-tRNA reductase [Mariniphaga sp.]|nr:glutamyl-tRNA reductase [Mariniphaga sp.]